MKKLITGCFLVLTILLFGQTAKAATSVTVEETSVTVEPSGDKSGLTDYIALRDAIKEYDTINLVDGGQYYLGGKGKGAINIDDNTTINATGATIRQMNTGKGIFKTTSEAADKAGYSALKNVKIEGGTWIGSTKKCKGYSLFKFFHGQNLVIENATFKDNYNGHLLEFAGCKDVIVRNCYFGGTYKGEATNEAVQFDNCTKGCLQMDSEEQYDNIPCKNILFENNTVVFARTVGSHHTSGYKGKFMSNITIRNNKLTATRDMGLLVYNWYDSKIENNTISGTSRGVDIVSFFGGAQNHFYGGYAGAKKNNSKPYNISLKNNTITTKYGPALRVKGGSVRRISGVTVENNTLETKSKSSSINLIRVEYANQKKGKGVVIRNNTLKGCYAAYPIYVTNSSYVTLQKMKYTVKSNKTHNVIQLTDKVSNTTVKNMTIVCNKKNTGNGIYAYNTTGVKLQSNTIQGAKQYGIHMVKSKKFSISKNKITKSGKKAILKK